LPDSEKSDLSFLEEDFEEPVDKGTLNVPEEGIDAFTEHCYRKSFSVEPALGICAVEGLKVEYVRRMFGRTSTVENCNAVSNTMNMESIEPQKLQKSTICSNLHSIL
jgi:hypothetical protein